MSVVLDQPARVLASTSEVTLETVNPLSYPSWDNDLNQFSEARIFHTSAWCRTLRQTYGFSPFYVVARREGRPVGILPWMEVRSLRGQRRGVSLPFTDSCPLLVADREPALSDWSLEGTTASPTTVATQILRRSYALGRERHWQDLEFRPGQASEPQDPASTQFYQHSVPLKPTDASQLAHCEPSVRRSLRQARESGLTVSIGTDFASIREYFGLHCLTRRRQGSPPQPMAFFTQIQEELLARGHGFVILARQGKAPVAGAVFLHSNRHATYKFGASDLAYQALRPNQLVMWSGFREAYRLGCQQVDLGRTSLQHEGLRRFKRGWGAMEIRQSYHRFVLPSGGRQQVPDRTSGWQTRLFQILPQWTGRWAGRLLYRYAA
ncbi:MAG: GNAT family N-acetyltransferase [Verrucomicrobia bacterium]|nr:GNAT family N-acetyltransferase [Verrucomicrobiota bacterium]